MITDKLSKWMAIVPQVSYNAPIAYKVEILKGLESHIENLLFLLSPKLTPYSGP